MEKFEERRMIEEMNYVAQIMQRISEKKPLNELLSEIMESCKELVNAEASSLLIYDPKEDILQFQVATGEKGNIIKNIVCKMGEGIAGWVALNRIPQLIDDCYKDPRFNQDFDKQSNFRTKSMLCVPMIHKDKLIGVIQVINKKGNNLFTNRDLDLFRILSDQCAIAIENARLIHVQIQQEVISRELKTARDIQQNLLPSETPKFSDIDFAVTIIPAKEIGGDYYNVYKINPDLTLFFICDVSGKSISAALIVSTIFSSIVTYFKLNIEFKLIDFVKCLNRVLIDSTTSEKFATCWFGLLDHKQKKITSLNAGHNDVYLFRSDGDFILLNKGGVMLGFADVNFECQEIMLKKDDVIVLYTDGVTEAMNLKNEFFGDERLIEILKKYSGKSSDVILNEILNEVRDFTKDAEQSDDITCGVIKVL